MSEKNNGGPAFPQPCAENGWASNNEYGQAGGGLSLRDYFAAKALQAMLSNTETLLRMSEAAGRELISPEAMIATASYRMADAMLAERSK